MGLDVWETTTARGFRERLTDVGRNKVCGDQLPLFSPIQKKARAVSALSPCEKKQSARRTILGTVACSIVQALCAPSCEITFLDLNAIPGTEEWVENACADFSETCITGLHCWLILLDSVRNERDTEFWSCHHAPALETNPSAEKDGLENSANCWSFALILSHTTLTWRSWSSENSPKTAKTWQWKQKQRVSLEHGVHWWLLQEVCRHPQTSFTCTSSSVFFPLLWRRWETYFSVTLKTRGCQKSTMEQNPWDAWSLQLCLVLAEVWKRCRSPRYGQVMCASVSTFSAVNWMIFLVAGSGCIDRYQSPFPFPGRLSVPCLCVLNVVWHLRNVVILGPGSIPPFHEIKIRNI